MSEKLEKLKRWMMVNGDELYADANPYRVVAEEFCQETGIKVSPRLVSKASTMLGEDPNWPGYSGKIKKLESDERALTEKEWYKLSAPLRLLVKELGHKPHARFAARVLQMRRVDYHSVQAVSEMLKLIKAPDTVAPGALDEPQEGITNQESEADASESPCPSDDCHTPARQSQAPELL